MSVSSPVRTGPGHTPHSADRTSSLLSPLSDNTTLETLHLQPSLNYIAGREAEGEERGEVRSRTKLSWPGLAGLRRNIGTCYHIDKWLPRVYRRMINVVVFQIIYNSLYCQGWPVWGKSEINHFK